jgi:WD40 repeat protein
MRHGVIASTAVFFVLFGIHASAVPVETAQGQRPEIFPQLGHSSTVYAIAISPDGRLLVSASGDRAVKLWDLGKGRELRTLTAHMDAVSAVAFSSDGKYVAAGDMSQVIKVWNVSTGQERSFGGGKGIVWSVAFSPDGKAVAAGSSNQIPTDAIDISADRNNNIELWDLASGTKRTIYSANPTDEIIGEKGAERTDFMRSVAFSRDGKLLAGGGADGVKIWTIADEKLKTTILEKDAEIGSIAFLPDSRTLISGGAFGGAITYWDVDTGRKLRTTDQNGYGVFSLSISSDGKLLAVGGEDLSSTLWDVDSGKQTGTFIKPHLMESRYLGDPRGQGLRRFVVDQIRFGQQGTPVVISPDGKMVASGLGDETVVQSTFDGKILNELGRTVRYIESIDISPDHKLIASSGFFGDIDIWDSASGRVLKKLKGHKDIVSSVVFSPDGKTIASGARDSTVRLWDLASGVEKREFSVQSALSNSVAFSRDGRLLASGDSDGTVKVWSVDNGKEMMSRKDTKGEIDSVAFSPDGTALVTGGEEITVWNASRGTPLRTILPPAGKVLAVAISHDGRVLATAGLGKTIDLWNMVTGQSLRSLQEHRDWITSLSFSPNSDTLASSSDDNTIKLWRVSDGKELTSLDQHVSIVTQVVWSSDGTRLASGSWDGTVRLWNPEDRKLTASLIAFPDNSSIAVTPEGFFDSSSEQAEENLNVRIRNRVFGISSFRENFYRPDLVKRALAGEDISKYGSIDKVKLSPEVEFADVPSTTNDAKLKMTLHLTNGGGGFGPVRVFWNGTVVEQDDQVSGSGDTLTRSYTVPLSRGDNSLRAEAFNADGSMWSDARAQITANLPAPTREASAHGTLHAMIVGIQSFPKAPANDLKYPIADAHLIAKTLTDKAAPLFESLDIPPPLTTPAETDKAHLISALKAMQAKVKPEDEFVFYVASHGIVRAGQYYLVTSDVGSDDPEGLKTTAISAKELSDLLANIHAAKKLVILDTCDAGAAGSSSSGGLTAKTAATILGRGYGFTVLTAASSNQDALGGYKDHGLFTYVVNDGLSGKAADTATGIVSSFLLADYVNDNLPTLAQTALHKTQQPTAEKSGNAFAVTKR